MQFAISASVFSLKLPIAVTSTAFYNPVRPYHSCKQDQQARSSANGVAWWKVLVGRLTIGQVLVGSK
jgi:hypothetical protein